MEKTKSPLSTVSKYSCVKEYSTTVLCKGKIKIWFNLSGSPTEILKYIESELATIKRQVTEDFTENKTENK